MIRGRPMVYMWSRRRQRVFPGRRPDAGTGRTITILPVLRRPPTARVRVMIEKYFTKYAPENHRSASFICGIQAFQIIFKKNFKNCALALDIVFGLY